MRKTQAQANKDHVARLRRKAKAFDDLYTSLQWMKKIRDEELAAKPVQEIRGFSLIDKMIEDAEKAVHE